MKPSTTERSGTSAAAKGSVDLFASPPAILEPHASLGYVGTLFKILGVTVFLIIVAEVLLGIQADGIEALPVLLLEVAQLLVIAGLLWGGGDIARLILETNHDIRASRVLLWQLTQLRRMELRRVGLEVAPVSPHMDPETLAEDLS
ncbi:MAG TPA: hypothetical protein VK837_05075 [Longimicrobiales bacterium]|nr:hypothetical protein [Longimicrobiales bacterium]